MAYEVVFDIETQNTFFDVANDITKLKVSVVSLYRSDTGSYHSFTVDELNKLWTVFEHADRLIGFNSEHFDLPVLNNYYPGNLLEFPHLDLLKKVKESLGIRLKLKDLAEATLDNVTKSADGLQAIKWWKEGNIADIIKYCEQDVKVTKELYDFGREHGQLFYKSLTGETLPFAIDFGPVAHQTGAGAVEKASATPKSINLTLPF